MSIKSPGYPLAASGAWSSWRTNQRGDVWLRIVASVLGIPLDVTAVGEGAAFGAALLGGVAGGVFATEA